MNATHFEQTIVPQPSEHPTAQQPLGGVGQDNPAPPHDRTASRQPASPKTVLRSQARLHTTPTRSQKKISRRKLVSATIWLSPSERAELQRVAQTKGLSTSQTGRSFIVAMLQQDLETQQGALLEAVITRLMRERERVFNNRFAALLTRFAVEMGQVRQLVTNLLPAVPGMTEEQAYKIIEEAYARSKRNLSRRYPELEGIIADLSKWLRNEREEENQRDT